MCVQREVKVNSLLQIDWHEFSIAPLLQDLARLLIDRYKASKLDCLTPRPECGAGSVFGGPW